MGNQIERYHPATANSATYDRARILEQLADAQREQAHAEIMLIAAIIRVADYSMALNALTEATREHGLVWPSASSVPTSRVLDAVMGFLHDLPGRTIDAEDIANYVAYDDYGSEPPFDLIARVCGIAEDTHDHSPFAYARKVCAAAARRNKLGQRVWTETLYRWFDWDGRLLYIGITRDLETRQESHRQRSSWSRFAARCEVQRYPSREAVEVAERNAIQIERPLFNHVHNDTPEARQRLVAYLVEQGHLDLLAPAVSRG